MARRYGTLFMVRLGTRTKPYQPYHKVRGTASEILAKKVSIKKFALFLQCYPHHEVQSNTPVLKLKKVKVLINSKLAVKLNRKYLRPGWQARDTLMKLLEISGGLFSSLVTIEAGYTTSYLSSLYGVHPSENRSRTGRYCQ